MIILTLGRDITRLQSFCLSFSNKYRNDDFKIVHPIHYLEIIQKDKSFDENKKMVICFRRIKRFIHDNPGKVIIIDNFILNIHKIKKLLWNLNVIFPDNHITHFVCSNDIFGTISKHFNNVFELKDYSFCKNKNDLLGYLDLNFSSTFIDFVSVKPQKFFRFMLNGVNSYELLQNKVNMLLLNERNTKTDFDYLLFVSSGKSENYFYHFLVDCSTRYTFYVKRIDEVSKLYNYMDVLCLKERKSDDGSSNNINKLDFICKKFYKVKGSKYKENQNNANKSVMYIETKDIRII